jgi:hypothetical protein
MGESTIPSAPGIRPLSPVGQANRLTCRAASESGSQHIPAEEILRGIGAWIDSVTAVAARPVLVIADAVLPRKYHTLIFTHAHNPCEDIANPWAASAPFNRINFMRLAGQYSPPWSPALVEYNQEHRDIWGSEEEEDWYGVVAALHHYDQGEDSDSSWSMGYLAPDADDM